MIGSRESVLNAKFAVQSMHEPSGELGTTIRDHFGWDAVKLEDLAVVDVGNTFCSHVCGSRQDVDLLAVVVGIDDDRIEASYQWKTRHQVDSHCLPGTLRYIVRLKGSLRMSWCFAALTEFASFDILADEH